VTGEFGTQTATDFKNDLKKCESGSEIHIRINSVGKNVWVLTLMRAFMYFMEKYKQCRFVAEIENAQSAALLFAVIMHERHVIGTSAGEIHLPETNRGGSDESEKSLRDDFLRIFAKRTRLRAAEVAVLNRHPLLCDDMVRDGIATKKVKKFIVLPA